jgi:hypothetical protein
VIAFDGWELKALDATRLGGNESSGTFSGGLSEKVDETLTGEAEFLSQQFEHLSIFSATSTH